MHRIFGHAEIHIAEGLQPAKAFVDVFDFKNRHHHAPYSAGLIAVLASDLLAAEQPSDALPTFDQTTGQKDHDQHEHQPQCQVPAFADERVYDRHHEVFHPVGQEGEPAVQNVVVDLREDVLEVFDEARAEDRAQQGAGATAGSSSEQPRPLAVHCIRSAPASGSIEASSPPASPAYMPEMTKAAKV